MRVWRLAREPFCRDREGTGAFLSGGRWTPPGTRVLHAASSIALAGLEYLVHARKPPVDLVLVAIDLPEVAPIEQPKLGDLPDDWASPLPSEHCQAWGRKWCESARALALAVPSVIVPEERNYVINVAHSAMPHVALKSIRRFAFDLRLIK
ncbi:MAG: RES family NAD+ phosphorylase [Tepidisphaeraceae bacterium]